MFAQMTTTLPADLVMGHTNPARGVVDLSTAEDEPLLPADASSEAA